MRLDKDYGLRKLPIIGMLFALAEEFTNGYKDYLNDLKRNTNNCTASVMMERSKKGVGHVHAAFTEAEPEGISEGMNCSMKKCLCVREIGIKHENCGVLDSHLVHIQEPAVETSNDDNFGLVLVSNFLRKEEITMDNRLCKRWHFVSNSLIHLLGTSQTSVERQVATVEAVG